MSGQLNLALPSGGSVTVAAPDSASDTTVTLPAGNVTLASDANGALYPLTSGTAQTSTSGTSIDFTGIPSWVKRITVMFKDISLSGTDHLLVQIGTGGTPTTSGYVSSSVYALGGSSQTGGASSLAGFIHYLGTASFSASGTFVLTNISGNNWISTGILGNYVTTPYTATQYGTVTLSGTLNIVRMTTTGSNTFDAGSINILYE